MNFSVTGKKNARVFYIILMLGVFCLVGFGNYLLLEVYPESGIGRKDIIIAYAVCIVCDIVAVLFSLLLLHMVFDVVYIDGRQIILKRLFRKEKEYDVNDVNRWCATLNRARTYWTSAITIHIGKEYIDINHTIHSNIGEMGKYLDEHCPEKKVDIINHW